MPQLSLYARCVSEKTSHVGNWVNSGNEAAPYALWVQTFVMQMRRAFGSAQTAAFRLAILLKEVMMIV